MGIKRLICSIPIVSASPCSCATISSLTLSMSSILEPALSTTMYLSLFCPTLRGDTVDTNSKQTNSFNNILVECQITFHSYYKATLVPITLICNLRLLAALCLVRRYTLYSMACGIKFLSSPTYLCSMELGQLACPSTESVRLINKCGLPLSHESIHKLWARVGRKHPQGREIEESIRGRTSLPNPPVPRPPLLSGSGLLPQRVAQLQRYLLQLQYNHTGMQYFEIIKNRPISRLAETARDMIRESLPIKCLEAVVLAIYLLAPIETLKMFVIGFKSEFKTRTHRHVVLGVSSNGKFGTVGLSRRPELMYKPIIFETLSALLLEFIESYQKCGHSVVKVDLSCQIPHDMHTCEVIDWKYLTLVMKDTTLDGFNRLLEKYSHSIRN